MEEVWKDINLSSLRSTEDTHKTSFRGAIFQDFLARPYDKHPPTSTVSSSFGSPPPPPPAIVLNLNSSPDQLNFFGNSNSLQQSSGLTSLSSQGFLGASQVNKRFPDSDNNSRERRHKRMMKNRESAARSRARKQESIERTRF
ncbi:basic region/leucine zipper motif 27 [Forsythia ovata]|uniref:Basic region/leucine zipper motif 27 n=1 Tax=Forsythia ovata TaxID=205694 RepID=A0ABD1US80_9LAMI